MSVRWVSLLIGTVAGIAAMSGDAAAVDSSFTTPSKAAKWTKVPLVTAFEPCASANSYYDTNPVFASSCVPPAQTADVKWGPKGTGSLSLALTRYVCGKFDGNACIDVVDPRPDIVVTVKLTDVRTLAGSPYSGSMGGGTTYLRITSTDNNPVSGNRSATTENIAFLIQDPPGQDCSAGKCTIVTSFLTTVPGMLEDGKRSNIELGVSNNSSSGQSFIDAPNGEHFATPGIFVP